MYVSVTYIYSYTAYTVYDFALISKKIINKSDKQFKHHQGRA